MRTETRETGGPAFPRTRSKDGWESDGVAWEQDGMTLRDYFAAKAMQGRLAGCMNQDGDSSDLEAAICYQIADAMLAERSK